MGVCQKLGRFLELPHRAFLIIKQITSHLHTQAFTFTYTGVHGIGLIIHNSWLNLQQKRRINIDIYDQALFALIY